MSFKTGQRVQFLDEVGGGEVISIGQTSVVVLLDEGFEQKFKIDELVPEKHHDIEAGLKDIEIKNKLHQDIFPDRPKRSVPHQKNSKPEIKSKNYTLDWSIDLHIEQLIDKYNHLTNSEILMVQMTRCRSFVDRAIEQNKKKVVLIHGKGEGVLKSAIHQYLIQRGDVLFDDANVMTYGKGATEVQFIE